MMGMRWPGLVPLRVPVFISLLTSTAVRVATQPVPANVVLYITVLTGWRRSRARAEALVLGRVDSARCAIFRNRPESSAGGALVATRGTKAWNADDGVLLC